MTTMESQLIFKKQNKVKNPLALKILIFSAAHLDRIFSTSSNNLAVNDAFYPQILLC